MAELISVSRDTDFEEIAAFQRRAFGYERIKSERRRLQCAEYYRWKYFPPAGPARLAAVRSSRGLVAMLAAVPFKLATADSTAWQICDIASDPEFRQRGLFARCLELVREAAADDVMFCFPNARSRRGLDKAGYSVVSRMRLQVRPIFALPFAGTGPAPAHSTNLPACEAAFQTCPAHRRFIQRSPEFLHWRYAAHPLNRYVCVAASGTGPSTSCVIVRHLTVLRMRLGIVVDGCSGSDEDARAGHAAARGWAKESGCSALVWARDLAMQSPSGTVMGNLERPWHVTCFARAVDGARFGGPAQMQLGDWDAV